MAIAVDTCANYGTDNDIFRAHLNGKGIDHTL